MKVRLAITVSLMAHLIFLALVIILAKLPAAPFPGKSTFVEVYAESAGKKSSRPERQESKFLTKTSETADFGKAPAKAPEASENSKASIGGSGEEKQGQGDFLQAEPKQTLDPVYPRLAKARNEEGKVAVLAKISESGTILSTNIVESSGYLFLDRSAESSFHNVEFTPAQKAGHAVSSERTFTFVFRLKEKK